MTTPNPHERALAEQLLAAEPPCPLLPLFTPEQVLTLLAKPDGPAALDAHWEKRRRLIALAQNDPLRHEPEPDFWLDARKAVEEHFRALIILGGNRSGKSWLCAKLAVEALVQHPGTRILAVSEDETASVETQQKIIWHYLPPEIRGGCHNKRDPSGIFYVNYTEANGFSERKLVLPLPAGYTGEPSRLIFATYGQEPDQFEGMMWGHPTAWTIGWWADENLRLAWLQMLVRRGKFQPGTGLWSYTPVHGITPTIKEAVGKGARTLEYRPAKLLADRVNVPGLPKGTMPYIQEPALPGGRVFYFHSEMSPFGPGPNGSGKTFAESVAEDCAGKPSEYIQRIAYGYTEDVIGLCYPKFRGDVHVLPPERLPAEGTNYVLIDPAGDRNWFILWVRVAPGTPRRYFIYREWPDAARYGEWAVASNRSLTQESHRGWDGERGPAQRNQGWGVVRYKALMLEEETVRAAQDEKDPHRLKLLADAVAAGNPGPVRETIRIRKVDPRAAVNPQASEKGGVNILTLFAEENRDPSGNVIGPRMTLLPAYSGKGIDDGIGHVNELLDWDEREPFCPVLNEPRLYVSATCKQAIWMFEHYTNRDSEGGCKDVADLVRYMAQDDDMRHVNDGGKLTCGGFKEGF
jgi:hypothetical protein